VEKEIKIFVIVLFACGLSYGQQQGLFTNFILNQSVYNPASIGALSGQQYNIGYRNQWMGFEGAPRTILVSGYGNMRKRPMSIGAMVMSEKIGLMDITSFYGLYSYNLKINKTTFLNFGLGAGGVQYSVKTFNARPYDKDDSYFGSGLVNAMAFDVNAGLYFQSKNFFLGASNQHMANSKIRWNNTLGHLTPHFYAYTGYNLRLGKKKEYTIQPAVMTRYNAPVPYQLEANLKISYKEKFWIAGNYRDRSSASVMAGLMIEKQFSVSYAYDLALTAISNYNSGSHEILLSYYIPFKKKRSQSEQIQDADEEELNTIDNTIRTTIKSKKAEEDGEKKEDTKSEEKPKKD
jgi:type IX secretion system PorP/SprF family membrane protein